MENKLRAYMDHLFQDVPNTKKAVEVKDDGSTVVYYQFVKVTGKWLVHIPTL